MALDNILVKIVVNLYARDRTEHDYERDERVSMIIWKSKLGSSDESIEELTTRYSGGGPP